MRQPVVAGNWKMNTDRTEATQLVDAILSDPSKLDGIEVILCPPFTQIETIESRLSGTSVQLGGQNLYPKKYGAYTGEISGPMLKSYHCSAVIVGHSERRAYFDETNTFINEKLKSAYEFGLTPIFCIGETLDQRKAGTTLDVLKVQLDEGLNGLKGAVSETGIIIAYEPVWAIGTGEVATPQQAQEAHAFIRDHLSGLFGAQIAERTRLLYGGSVKPENFGDLIIQPDIDGALVGGASLNPISFGKLIEIARNAIPSAA